MLGDLKDGRYALQSPPAVFGDVVITGCSNGEGSPSAGAYGDIRGWDAKTGKLLWTFHTVPRPGEAGIGNVAFRWLEESIGDQRVGVLHHRCEARDCVCAAGLADLRLLWRGPGWDGLYGNSLVALDARTGTKKWHQQLVHHDLWDYDLAAPPALFDIRRGGRVIPAVAQITKMGLLFVFDRVTGEPVYGMEERPVPQTAVPGEVTSKTQPFPLKPPPLAKNTFRMEEMYDRSPEHARFCRELFEANQMKIGAPYTPLPLEGNALFFPSTLGGGNWGGVSIDPSLGLLFVNVMNVGQWGHMEKRGSDVHADFGLRAICAVLGSGDPDTVPESAVRRADRGRFGFGRHCVAIGAGQDRGAGGDRRARYRDAESGRQHRDGGRRWCLSGRRTIPGSGRSIRGRESCFGKRSWRPAGTAARSHTWDATGGNTWR